MIKVLNVVDVNGVDTTLIPNSIIGFKNSNPIEVLTSAGIFYLKDGVSFDDFTKEYVGAMRGWGYDI